MLSKGRTRLALVCGALAAAGGASLAALPAASADECTVTVTVAGGAPLVFTVHLPPGTPLSQVSLPVQGPIISESMSCAKPAPPPATTPSPSSASPPPQPSGPSGPQGPPEPAGPAKTQAPSGVKPAPVARAPKRVLRPAATRLPPASVTRRPATSRPPALQGVGGVPLVSNPTFSFALPGPAPVGVPDFFIEKFQIPPFLLPIYWAAGIEFDVPWQVLAAINEVETDYGRNLSVSSAGAVGWMQFLPSTWREWGVDGNRDGVADPYNPVDAIFTAARYLHAAGASRDLGGAVFAYNHAGWYVQSVLLRAKLIGGMPRGLIGALSGLVQGYFPVAAPSRYADDAVVAQAMRHARRRSVNPGVVLASSRARGVSIFAAAGSAVIAVQDGTIVGLGRSARLGRFVRLQDATGNVYTYAGLGSVRSRYEVPKPVRVSAGEVARELAATPAPRGVAGRGASAGSQALPAAGVVRLAAVSVSRTLTGALSTPTPTPSPAAVSSRAAAPTPTAAGAGFGAAGVSGTAPLTGAVVKERLFAHPDRPASYQAGGQVQVLSERDQLQNFRDYLTPTLHLAKDQYTLAPLRKGAIVTAGTLLGRIAAPQNAIASHLRFGIQPAGSHSPAIDPKPILDGWKLLAATAIYRANGKNALMNANQSIGQILLETKPQLQQRVLSDPHIKIYACGRRDIAAGSVDRRVLAALEFLSTSGLDPTVNQLACNDTTPTPGTLPTLTTSTVSIDQINAIPIQGHQGPGSITDLAIRRLLTLQGPLAPTQIISLMNYKNQPNTLALPDHTDHLQITYTPQYGQNKHLTQQITSTLKPHQWINLIHQLATLPEPTIPTTPSPNALHVPTTR